MTFSFNTSVGLAKNKNKNENSLPTLQKCEGSKPFSLEGLYWWNSIGVQGPPETKSNEWTYSLDLCLSWTLQYLCKILAYTLAAFYHSRGKSICKSMQDCLKICSIHCSIHRYCRCVKTVPVPVYLIFSIIWTIDKHRRAYLSFHRLYPEEHCWFCKEATILSLPGWKTLLRLGTHNCVFKSHFHTMLCLPGADH